METILSAVIAGAVTLIGVLIANSRSQAVTDTKLEELTREVREHNNFARRVPILAQKRYQGQRDIPLSPEGAAQLRRADFDPDVVYVSTLQRTSQTARILFPEAKLVPVDGLKEMCFGSFEGRNFIEMEKDPEYQAWVKANCESPCPDGERKTDFSDRICRTVAELIDKALAAGEERLVILAHGGTQMAALERYALPHKDYYEWCGPNAGGFVLDAADWADKRVLHLIKTVQYTREADV